MTVPRLVPSIRAGLQGWPDRDSAGPKTAMSRVVLETADYVKRKGPVSVRDVATWAGLTLAGAKARLRAAAKAQLVRETEGRWTA